MSISCLQIKKRGFVWKFTQKEYPLSWFRKINIILQHFRDFNRIISQYCLDKINRAIDLFIFEEVV